MLNIGDKVLYGAAGACTVTDICRKKFGDAGEREYYVLVPIHDNRTTLYLPVDNEKLMGKVKQLLSVEEIEDLIRSMPDEKPIWIADEKLRQETYKSMLRSGNRRDLVSITKALYNHRQKMASMGRKLHIADEKLLHEAEKLLCDEFAAVLDLQPSEVNTYIMSRLEPSKAANAQS